MGLFFDEAHQKRLFNIRNINKIKGAGGGFLNTVSDKLHRAKTVASDGFPSILETVRAEMANSPFSRRRSSDASLVSQNSAGFFAGGGATDANQASADESKTPRPRRGSSGS